jgi:hypothetical protein
VPLLHLLVAAVLGHARPSEQVFWEAPDGCPDQAELRARVDEMLAAGGSGRRDPVRLNMVVSTTDSGFRLTASLFAEEGALGQRVVQGVACPDLASAAVLIAALAIDPDIVPPEPDTGDDEPEAADADVVPEEEPKTPPIEVEPRHAPTPPPSPPTSPMASPMQSVDDSTRPRAVVGVVHFGMGLGLGRLAAPLPMLLGRLGAGIERGAFRALVRASGFGPSVGDVPGFPGGGTFGAFTGGAAGCGRTQGSPWSFVGCLATDVGLAQGRGRGTATTRSNRSLWWGIEAEAAVEYALNRRWSLTGAIDGGVMPLRTRFIVEGQGHACCVRWSAGLRFGVLARFGRFD